MISVIIVNWNTGSLLRHCLRSLKQLPERSLIERVIVIDNASRDNSIALAKRQGTNKLPVEFILLKNNVGFSKANNMGLRLLKGRTDVLLLNPDTEVKPAALERLVHVLMNKSDVGIVGPKLVNSDGSVQPSVRRFPNIWVLIFLFLKIHRLWPAAKVWRSYMATDMNYDKAQAVEQIMGAAFLIRSDLINTQNERYIGLLDERFFIWFEEVDYCKRVIAAGWQVWYAPEATVMHHGGASFQQWVGPKRAWPFLKSALQFAGKHLGWGGTFILSLVWPVALALSVPTALWHGLKPSVRSL